MKRLMPFACLLTVAALACLPAAVLAGQPVPFKTATDYVLQGPPGPAVPHEFLGVSIGSHIGKSTTVAYVTPDFSTRPPTYTVYGTITAANGDEIDFIGAATFTSANTTRGTVHFIGGTGRFEGATGQLDYEETLTFDPTGQFVIAVQQDGTGVISY